MKNIALKVEKAAVYEEIAKSTSYVGAKMLGDESAYKRIFTKDADQLMLERFWVETCSAITEHLKRFILTVSSHSLSDTVDLTDNYEIELKVSNNYNDALTGSIEVSLFNCVVASIIGKWFRYTNRDEADAYNMESAGYLDNITRKLYNRKRPSRPTTNE